MILMCYWTWMCSCFMLKKPHVHSILFLFKEVKDCMWFRSLCKLRFLVSHGLQTSSRQVYVQRISWVLTIGCNPFMPSPIKVWLGSVLFEQGMITLADFVWARVSLLISTNLSCWSLCWRLPVFLFLFWTTNPQQNQDRKEKYWTL